MTHPSATASLSCSDKLDSQDALPKTIIYPLNPRDNELVAAMIGVFQRGLWREQAAGRQRLVVQRPEGRHLRQLESLSQLGMLSRFVASLTDSRSFTSYTRHEYFRRILCNLLGGEIERGELPDDLPLIGGMVQDISYRNAVNYFQF